MRIITVPEPARKFRVATRAEMEAVATFTLTLTERDIVRVHALFDEWAIRESRWACRRDRTKPGTRTFKWVEIAGRKTFYGLTVELRTHGATPPAEWCGAIRRLPREKRPFVCAIADTPWTHASTMAVFPCVYVNGEVNFLPAEGGDYTGWRWLVEV